MSRLIKICGLRTQADIDAAQGADFCGFIFHPASPRNIAPDDAAQLDTHGMVRTGVFVTDNVGEIVSTARRARLDMVQLHGDQSPEAARAIAAALRGNGSNHPGSVRVTGIIRVLWPARFPSMDALNAAMRTHAVESDLFLMEAGTSGGGSGTTVDLDRLQGMVAPRPWLLAGGLGPENVLAALHASGAHGADLNSSLESSPGCKDHDRVRSVLSILRGNL